MQLTITMAYKFLTKLCYSALRVTNDKQEQSVGV